VEQGILTVFAVIAVIYLLISQNRLKKRLGNLEARLAPPPAASEAATTPTPKSPAAAVSDAGPWAKPDTPPDETPVAMPAPPPTPPAERGRPPKAFVFRKDLTGNLITWAIANWFLAIAALSLALAGVFLVQYGVENGLLTPVWRVIGALALGAALIVAAELIRRRWGDDADSHSAYLPSTFAGAGLVTLFAAVLAARQMYGLIGAELAFAALIGVSLLAVALGWFYGPLLAITGTLGASAAPFLVGGSSDTPQLYFYYFALIAIAGLLIDAIRRWAWVSVFSLIFSYSGAFLIFASSTGQVHYLGFGLIAALAAATIPPLRWRPAHAGAMVQEVFRWKKAARRWPEFPTRLASASFAASTGVVILVGLADIGPAETWLAFAALAALYLAATVWFRPARALADLAVLPPLAFLLLIAQQGADYGTLFSGFTAPRPPESAAPWDVSILTLMALIGAALAFWRSQIAAEFRLAWAGGAALFAPMTLVVLEIWWAPAAVLGAYPWALHALAIAAAMTLFAQRGHALDAPDKRRAAIFTLSALTMISFALIVVLSSVALTVSLAVMVLLAAAIDRWQNMRLLPVFVQIGVIVVGWRLILDPGVIWAFDAPLWQIWLGYGGVVALFLAAWLILPQDGRAGARITLESAIWTLPAVFVSVLLYRWFGADLDTHWGISLMALVWLISMVAQLYRLQIGGRLRWVRIVLAAVFGTFGLTGMALVLTFFNPLLSRSETVLGPPVLDTLLVAFGLPAACLIVIAWRLRHLATWLRTGAGLAGAGLAATYVAFEIRRAWRGDILAVPGTTDPELYSYTVAMLLSAVALLFLAFARRSDLLRKVAMLGIALTIAKVFLIDMSGLAGLTRVASFLGLGLSLAGLAWINRRMSEQWDRKPSVPRE